MPSSGATVAQIDDPVSIMSIEPIFTCCTTSASLPSWLLGKYCRSILTPGTLAALAAKRWYQMKCAEFASAGREEEMRSAIDACGHASRGMEAAKVAVAADSRRRRRGVGLIGMSGSSYRSLLAQAARARSERVWYRSACQGASLLRLLRIVAQIATSSLGSTGLATCI